jgi:hypothetical protein
MVKQKIVQKPKEKTAPKKKAVQALEDSEIFTLTTGKKIFYLATSKETTMLNQKRKKGNETKGKKVIKNTEERKIKRIEKEMKLSGIQESAEIKKDEQIYDLWENEKKSQGNIKLEPLTYPKVVIPHPGQSYNPNREDLKNLLLTLIENEKPKVDMDQKPIIDVDLKEGVFAESDEEVEKNLNEIKISNNPAVRDEDRLTKRDRNKMVTSF